MSFHEYYNSLPTTTLHEIHHRLNELENNPNTGTGGNDYDDTEVKDRIKALEDGDTTEILNKLNKIYIKLRNKVYHDEWFKPDYSIAHNNKFRLDELINFSNGYCPIIMVPFINSKILEGMKTSTGFTTQEIPRFENCVKYLGNFNFYNFLNNSNFGLNLYDFYISFWLFNNVDLTKQYTSMNIEEFTNTIRNEFLTLIDKSNTILEGDKLTFFNNFIDVISNSSTVYPSIIYTINIFYSSLSENEIKEITLYVNICICLNRKLTLTFINTGDEALISMNDLKTKVENMFLRITGRTPTMIPIENITEIF
jgi:hypothetical protein